MKKHSNPIEKYEGEISKLKSLSKKNLSGVITTNYDLFFEDTFSDYKPFVGQDNLCFSAIQGIAEIYKIHGSVNEPESLVINDSDYRIFREKGKYLASKLLTIFMDIQLFLLVIPLEIPISEIFWQIFQYVSQKANSKPYKSVLSL